MNRPVIINSDRVNATLNHHRPSEKGYSRPKKGTHTLEKLKNNKCKDPHGHINELYKSMGEDGMKSLLDMLNQIKLEIIIPSKLNVSNVSTIYKGKGSKQEVINLRGIFKLPIIRNILDRMICNDEEEDKIR